jgi:hypothetical protein
LGVELDDWSSGPVRGSQSIPADDMGNGANTKESAVKDAMRYCKWAVAIAALLAAGGEARADLVFTLEGVTFSDGGTATGTITTNGSGSDFGSVISYDITTSAVGSFAGFRYTAANSLNLSTVPAHPLLATGLPIRLFLLGFDPVHDSTGAVAYANLSSSYEFFGRTFAVREVTSGMAVLMPDPAAVPEPAAFLTASSAGLIALGYGWRRRRRTLAAA